MNREEFEKLSPEKLLDKIQELNKRLFKMNPNSGMYGQLRSIINEAQFVYQEHLAVSRYDAANEERDSVINIGEIESEVYTPDYSNNTALDSVVQSYLGDKK